MTTNFLLTGILTDFQLKLLDFIQSCRKNVKDKYVHTHNDGAPIITLQYRYIVALFNCSPSSIKTALDRLCDIGLLTQVSNHFGECATFQYNPKKYQSLIKEAKQRKCILVTGRNKQQREATVETVLKFMTGKAVKKADKHR